MAAFLPLVPNKNKPEETTVPVTESEYGDYAESDITLPALDTDNGERIVNLVYNKGKDRIELYTEIYNDKAISPVIRNTYLIPLITPGLKTHLIF